MFVRLALLARLQAAGRLPNLSLSKLANKSRVEWVS